VKAVGGIAEIDRSVIPFLGASLKDKDRHVARVAADMLGLLGPVALPTLRDVMKDPNRETRLLVVYALAYIRQEAVPDLMKALKDPDLEITTSVVHSLLTSEAGIRAVQVAAKDEDVRRRRQIIATFSSGGLVGANAAKTVDRMLIEAVSDTDPELRRLAIAGFDSLRLKGLASADAKDLVLALLRILRDPKTEKSLRKKAFELLNGIDPAAANAAVGLGDP
jgi:HEAT repeat protein